MTVLESVLIEEINRLEKNISVHESYLKQFPRGTIFIRQMGRSSFAYRKRKENGLVVTEYLGNVNNEEVKQQISLSVKYKKVKSDISFLKKELVKLKKAYRAYNK